MNPYNIPKSMQTPELKNAFYTMRSFLENEQDYFLYQKRLDSERERATWQTLINIAQKDASKAQKDANKAQKELNKAEKYAEKERLARINAEKEIKYLNSLLAKAGISA